MDLIAQYNLTGIVIGVATFLIIGLFHPLVIKGEYYFGVKIWWVFLVMGIVAVGASILVRQLLDAAGRLGRLVALEHRRALRTAQKGRPGLVPAQPAPEILTLFNH